VVRKYTKILASGIAVVMMAMLGVAGGKRTLSLFKNWLDVTFRKK
jgi:hypothetical protein